MTDPIDLFPVRPCVGSGFCCKRAPCEHGTWNEARSQCAHLQVVRTMENGAEVHACGLYDQIVSTFGPNAYPYFGAGCCSPMFNENRIAIIAGLRQEQDAAANSDDTHAGVTGQTSSTITAPPLRPSRA